MDTTVYKLPVIDIGDSVLTEFRRFEQEITEDGVIIHLRYVGGDMIARAYEMIAPLKDTWQWGCIAFAPNPEYIQLFVKDVRTSVVKDNSHKPYPSVYRLTIVLRK